MNKTDTVTPGEQRTATDWVRDVAGDIPVLPMCALSGQGVAEWMDALLGGAFAGRRVIDVDYDRYADAEAALGWLNAEAEIISGREFSPKAFAETLMKAMQLGARDSGLSVAHVKALVFAGASSDSISLTDSDGKTVERLCELQPRRPALADRQCANQRRSGCAREIL
jgi:hypothetical protein